MRDGGEKRGFSRVRKAHEPRIGDELEPKPDGFFFSRLAGIGTARRAVGGRLKVRVAEAAVPALQEHHAVADLQKFREFHIPILVENFGAGRHLDHDIRAARAGAVRAHAVAAGLRLEVLLVAIVDQRVQPVDAFYNHIAAAAAVAAVRPAIFDELLAPERDAAVAARAGRDVDFRFIEKFHPTIRFWAERDLWMSYRIHSFSTP